MKQAPCVWVEDPQKKTSDPTEYNDRYVHAHVYTLLKTLQILTYTLLYNSIHFQGTQANLALRVNTTTRNLGKDRG